MDGMAFLSSIKSILSSCHFCSVNPTNSTLEKRESSEDAERKNATVVLDLSRAQRCGRSTLAALLAGFLGHPRNTQHLQMTSQCMHRCMSFRVMSDSGIRSVRADDWVQRNAMPVQSQSRGAKIIAVPCFASVNLVWWRVCALLLLQELLRLYCPKKRQYLVITTILPSIQSKQQQYQEE